MSGLFFLCSGSSTPPSNPDTEPKILASRSDSGSSATGDLPKETVRIPSPLYYERAKELETIVQASEAGDLEAQCALLYALDYIMDEDDSTLEKQARDLRSKIGPAKFEAFKQKMTETQDPRVRWTVELDLLIEDRAAQQLFDSFYQKVESTYLTQAPVTARELMERVNRHMGNTEMANLIRQQIDEIHQILRTVVTK